MYGLDLLSKHEYKMLCIYENFQEDARCFLEDHGKLGKLYLAALTDDKKEFEELYRDYQFDCVDSDD
jgi:hypothetical protein